MGGQERGNVRSVTIHPVLEATRWLGLDDPETALFDRFAIWLVEEAIPAGGLGPNEANRVWERHIVDGVLFAAGWDKDQPPESIVDLGSGVGLPAVPLALLWPQTQVIAIERSGRRADLLKRAVRIVGMDNIEVRQTEIARAPRAPMVTMRAVLAPSDWESVRHLATPGGVVLVGGSPDEPAGPDDIVVPATVDGSRRSFRIMRA